MKKLNKIRIINLVYILLVFSLGTNLSAQTNADSLESALKNANKSQKLTILNKLSSYYLTSSAGKAIEYGLQAKDIANELKDKPGEIAALLNIGDAYLSLADDKQAFTYYEKALVIAKSASLQKEIAQVSLKIGNHYNINSVYDEALKYDLEALKIYKTIDDKSGLSKTYHDIGIIYYYLGNYDKSLDFNQNALKIREELNDKPGIGKSLNNIALLYMNLGKNDKALEYYFKGLKIMEELNSISEQSYAMTNIGNTYKRMEDYENALNYYLKSLAMYEQFNDNRNKSKLLACLGTTYTYLKKYDQSESYLEQGLSLAKKTGYVEMIALNYKYLADLYLMLGDYKSTLEYKTLFFEIKDSVFSEKNQQSIAEFQIRIETDNTKREAELLKEKNNLLYLLIISLSLTFVIILFVVYSRNKTKRNGEIALDKLNAINYEANISIEQLILWSNCQNGSYQFAPKDINLSEEINHDIQLSKPNAGKKNIDVTSSISANINVNVDPIALNLIIRYLIFSAVKNSSEGDRVAISASPKNNFVGVSITYPALSKNSDDITRLFARDIQQIISNKDNEPRENLGLALCKEFVENSGGKIWVEPLAGKQSSIVFTLPEKS